MGNFLGRLYLRGWRWLRRPGSGSDRPNAFSNHRGDRPGPRPHVLVVSPYSIHPVIHGAAVRISNLIRRMSECCRVSLLILGEGTDDPGHRDFYGPSCERVLFHRLPTKPDPNRDPCDLLPPAAAPFTHRAVTDRISALVDAHEISVVQLEFAELGGHVLRDDRARTVLVEHDIGFTTQQRQRELAIADRFDAADRVGANPLDGVRQERFETIACATADQVHCMSENDRAHLASRLGSADHLRVIPNGVDTRIFAPGPAHRRRGVLFLGSFPHLPNLDAFEHLMDTVWPEIRRRTPDATLTVAGARPPESVFVFDGRDGVRVIGEVDEVAPLYDDHRALIVPLRAGSGTRLKILEAMASGLPVVSTTIGAEGLVLSDPPELILADDDEKMADAVAGLLAADDAEIEARGARGRALVERRYDWDSVAEDLQQAYGDLTADEAEPSVLTVKSVDPPDSSKEPAVSVVIPIPVGGDLGRGLVNGLASQRFEQSFEVVVVAHETATHCGDWRSSGFRVVSVDGPAGNQGAALNAGARAARGSVLVFTAPNAIPVDSSWLSALVAPFDHDRPPAAVQGGVTAQLFDGSPPHDPGFDRVSARWNEAHQGSFSLANVSIPKEVWQRYPFPPHAALADRAWQRIAADHGLLVLPCLAAAIRLVEGPGAGSIYRNARLDGGAWRRLGERYTITDLWNDLRRSRPCLDAESRPAPPATRGHRVYGLVRPFGLFLGNRFGAP